MISAPAVRSLRRIGYLRSSCRMSPSSFEPLFCRVVTSVRSTVHWPPVTGDMYGPGIVISAFGKTGFADVVSDGDQNIHRNRKSMREDWIRDRKMS